MSTQVHPTMKVSELDFDLKNPRLSEYELGANSTDVDVIRVLWEAMDVRELVLSIAASGFFSHEPIIVAKEDGRNVVIEGNRRLAAVKVLLDPTFAGDFGDDVPVITPKDSAALLELPVLISTREDAWQYLGFKHVNGPAKWSSYAKSQYIADVHRDFGVPLEDIARQIGDTHKTVQRLFRGLMVIEQAESMGLFNREDRYNRHFSFSHLYTGIDYDGISSFIGLLPETEENAEPVPADRKEELRELCIWLYGSKRDDRRPVIRSQNPDLRHLNEVLKDGEAVAALRAGKELTIAFEISRPSSNVFEEALYEAKRDLEKARSLVSTGYDGSDQLLTVANDVAELAVDLYDDMYRKHSPRRKPKTARDG
ncbi:MAG: ParB N-terminal domain-containing protein [Chloroflexota bacterium]|nr:ParB N-terminal domain-containing protein [Chloroflexota bacterium]MDE2840628.1 ParB N-terminal domain-containing protein [Chloroflexota bacterium]MDE2931626.1 ParB N-terminal domain-containing protein [Chloroflexota bacterium]